MPLVTQPALIEVSDLTGGYAPDGANDAMDPSMLVEVSNLLPDRNTLSLQTRDGFTRMTADFDTGTDLTSSHHAQQLVHFNADGSSWVVVVFAKNANEADNVQLYAVEMNNSQAVTRIDNGATWSNPMEPIWFTLVDHVLYGGQRGTPMFSWDAAGPTWDDDAATPNTKTWVDQTGGSVTPSTQYGRDFAFTGKEFVLYSGDIYTPQRDIRFKLWKSGEHYSVGDKVSHKLSGEYLRSYRCIKGHTAGSTNRPDDGVDYATYWKRVRLDDITDDDGDVTSDWAVVTQAAEASVAEWHADRLFLRLDRHRVQYSAPIKPDTSKDATDTEWNPRDWAVGNDIKGPGGGWIPIDDGARSGDITALHSFGQYLLVFKQHQIWTVSGSDDLTWSVRRVGKGHGCVAPDCVVELDGLVYFLASDGLYVTDGTSVEEAPGNNKLQVWLERRIDNVMEQSETDGYEPRMFKWKGFIGIILNDQTDQNLPRLVLFYDPETQSFWPTDLPAVDFFQYTDHAGRHVDNFVWSPAAADDDPPFALLEYSGEYEVDDENGSLEDNIFWYLRTAWLPFGTAHNERRIRKTWAVVKGGANDQFTLEGYREWNSDTLGFQTTRTVTTTYTQHIEGLWMPDSHAIQLYIDGDNPHRNRLFGYAVHTEPRRQRYHA